MSRLGRGSIFEALGGLFTRFTRRGRFALWVRCCPTIDRDRPEWSWCYQRHDAYGSGE
jgi:hypothetical protein